MNSLSTLSPLANASPVPVAGASAELAAPAVGGDNFADALQRARGGPARRGSRSAAASEPESPRQPRAKARAEKAAAPAEASTEPLAAPGQQLRPIVQERPAHARARSLPDAAIVADDTQVAQAGAAAGEVEQRPPEPDAPTAAQPQVDAAPGAPQPADDVARHMAHWLSQAQAWVPARANAPAEGERVTPHASQAVEALPTPPATALLHGLDHALAMRPSDRPQVAAPTQVADAAAPLARLAGTIGANLDAGAVQASSPSARHAGPAAPLADRNTPSNVHVHGLPRATPAQASPRQPAATALAVDAAPAARSEASLSSGSVPAAPERAAASLEAPAVALPSGAASASRPDAGVDAFTAPELAKPEISAEIDAPVASPLFGPALGARLLVLARDGVEQARLELNPAELGPVTARIALDGNAAHIDFICDVPSTRDALEASLPSLAAALSDGGLTLSGGGVFDRPRQPRDETGEAPRDGQGRVGRAEGGLGAPGGLALAAGTALPGRARGLVDLVA